MSASFISASSMGAGVACRAMHDGDDDDDDDDEGGAAVHDLLDPGPTAARLLRAE